MGSNGEPGLPTRGELGCYARADVLHGRHQITSFERERPPITLDDKRAVVINVGFVPRPHHQPRGLKLKRHRWVH
jgi:hypothetical protein